MSVMEEETRKSGSWWMDKETVVNDLFNSPMDFLCMLDLLGLTDVLAVVCGGNGCMKLRTTVLALPKPIYTEYLENRETGQAHATKTRIRYESLLIAFTPTYTQCIELIGY